MPRDLVKEPPEGDFALPRWVERERLMQIIDALNRGTADADSDDYESDSNEP